MTGLGGCDGGHWRCGFRRFRFLSQGAKNRRDDGVSASNAERQ